MNARGLFFACAVAALLGIMTGFVVSVIEINKIRDTKTFEIGDGNGRE